MIFIWYLIPFRQEQSERVNDEVRWSPRVLADRSARRDSIWNVSLARRQRALPLLGGGPSLYLEQSTAAGDLIAPGFMATLMVHLALTRLDEDIPRRAFACVRATIRKYLVKNGLGRPLDWAIWLRAHGCVHCTNWGTAPWQRNIHSNYAHGAFNRFKIIVHWKKLLNLNTCFNTTKYKYLFTAIFTQ